MQVLWQALRRIGMAAWLVWLLWSVAGAALLAQWKLNQLGDAFQTDARIVHRLLSQRAAQHDAILNTLALLQPNGQGEDAPAARLPSVFPQLLAVHGRGPGQSWGDAALEQAEAASRAQGRAVLARVDLARGRFDLLRAAQPASWALTIGLAALVPGVDWPMPVQDHPARVWLEHASTQYVLQSGAGDAGAPGGWPQVFRKPLGSESQPLDVVARQRLGWSDLPWVAMAACSAFGALVLTGLGSWRRQRAGRRRAEELLRLGQVARLNTLGELAAGLAHELNQPLTAVLAGTQAAQRLLDEGGRDGAEETGPDLVTARRAMAQAVAQARRAADVLARLRRTMEVPVGGAVHPGSAVVELAEVARRALDLLEPEIERLGARASVQADAPIWARADVVVLEQIMHNLLGNALHALAQVPADTRTLIVRVSGDALQAALCVADTGPGVPPERLAKVFEPFFTTREGGLGLGLSLSESLAGSLGGMLTAAANAPRGALFTLVLPREKAPT